MLKNTVLLCALFAAALASSEFCILHTPSAVSFRDARAIPSNDVGKVICSALKLPLTDPSEWDGMYITSAFGTPSAVIVLEVEGRGSGSYGDLKTQTYAIDGDDAHQSIAQAGEHVKESRALYVALDLTDGPSTFSQYDNIFGEVNAKPTKSSTSLKSDNPEHEKFLQQYTLLKEFIKLLPTARVLPQLVTIRFSTLEGNVEAKKMLDDAVVELTEAVKTVYNADDVLVLSTSSKTSRAKRAADDSAKQTKGDPIPEDLNVAKQYSDNYPVIFNIILWFGVVIAFSLLAISYAIAGMDPGRDSIIYRMTSNRIKKDN